MRLSLFALLIVATPAFAQLGSPAKSSDPAKPADQAWIARSNAFTQQLLDISIKYSPEQASSEGLAQYDTQIGDVSRKAEDAQRAEEKAEVVKLQAALQAEKDLNVAEDLQIILKAEDLGFRSYEFANRRRVPFINASNLIFYGLQPLLDDQVPQSRRQAAVERLKKYAGTSPGFTPITLQLIERMKQQMAKPDMIYPSRADVTTQLARNGAIVQGLHDLLIKYNVTGWEAAYAAEKQQLADYDAWVTANILPRARTDFRLQPEEYALAFEGYGIDIPPAQIAAMAHKAFAEYQAQMQTLAAEIARQHGYKSSDYRDVIRELKKQQLRVPLSCRFTRIACMRSRRSS